jgi:hypothetical protein
LRQLAPPSIEGTVLSGISKLWKRLILRR